MQMKVLRIGICDDNAEDREHIKEEIQNCIKMTEVNIRPLFYMYSNGKELMEASQNEEFQLVFLDVVMPGQDGFELAGHLYTSENKVRVVFVSDYEDKIFDSYEYMPVFFVRKRKLGEDIYRALKQYFRLTSFKAVSYKLKEGFGYLEVLLSDIIYIECNGHELSIKTRAGRLFRSYGSLKTAEEELASYGFIRVHRSYLVNEMYIGNIEEGSELVLTEGSRVPIGKAWEKRLQSSILGSKKSW